MKQTKILLCIFVSFLMLLFGCSKKVEYKTEGPIITVTVSQSDQDDYRNLVKEEITIYADRKVTLTYNTDHPSLKGDHSGAPVLKRTLTEEEFDEVKSLLINKSFFTMDDVPSRPDSHGVRYSVTAYIEDQTKELSAWNPTHKPYREIAKHIINLFNNNDRESWREEAGDYIWKTEAHAIHDVEQYQKNGPFITLSLLEYISTDYYSEKYEKIISLDEKGHINVHAFKDGHKIDDIAPLHHRVPEEKVNHFKDTLLEEYWKLERQIHNQKHLSPDEITVHLADDTVTVSEATSGNPSRYNDIAEELISFLEEDKLYEWEQEVLYYYNHLYKDEIIAYLKNKDDTFLQDVKYIFTAPKVWEPIDLSKLANIALLQKTNQNEIVVGLEINNERIITDSIVNKVGIVAMDEIENVKELKKARDIIEEYDLDKLRPYSISDENFSLDDEVYWGIWLQFEDGTVKDYKNSGLSGDITIPEDFRSLAHKLEYFVQAKVRGE